jgi:hypothetical protein
MVSGPELSEVSGLLLLPKKDLAFVAFVGEGFLWVKCVVNIH